MKKLLKWAGFAALGLVFLLGIFAVTAYAVSQQHLTRKHRVTVNLIPIPSSAEAVARGKHLAQSRGCIDCHGDDFAGNKIIDDGAMGKIYGPNITPGGDRVAGFQDEDWIRAIRHGVSRDGHALAIMPSNEYSGLTNADLGALVAFLKTVPAVKKPSEPIQVGPVARVLLTLGKLPMSAELIDHSNLEISNVEPGITVEYGRYLAVGCIGCHNPSFSGGKIDVGPPDWPHAANLTPHANGALTGWSEADFITALRTGKRPNGTELNPAMPRAFGNMDDTELKALWLFFHSVPAKAKGEKESAH